MVALTFRTTDGSKWGAGKGANLTPTEVDENFWSLRNAVVDLQTNPILPNNILDIVVADNAMTIILTDYSTYGPFPLPEAAFTFRGPWAQSTNYALYDFFTANEGLYLVLQAHTSSAGNFNPDDGNILGPYYGLILPAPNVYDIGFSFAGRPGKGVVRDVGDVATGAMFSFEFVRPVYMPIDAQGSLGSVITQAFANIEFPIFKNFVQVGTANIDAGDTFVWFDIPDIVQFEQADRLRILRPEFLDDTATDLTITFALIKGFPT